MTFQYIQAYSRQFKSLCMLTWKQPEIFKGSGSFLESGTSINISSTYITRKEGPAGKFFWSFFS